MDKLEKAKEVVNKHVKDARLGIYNTRNLVSDDMTVIYDDGELRVEICYPCMYFEVFGLTSDQFEELKRFYKRLVS